MGSRVRVAIAGVGNNASALVQGVLRYSEASVVARGLAGREGILFPRLCGYDIQDVEFSAAFDVDARKIGRDLGEAIFQEPNRYPRVLARDPVLGVVVHAAPALDGVPPFLAEMVDVASQSRESTADAMAEECVTVMKQSGTDVLVNFLPSGSDEATRFFARAAVAAGAAYINCTPTPAVHADEIREAFERAGLPILGDDLESQFGSSLIHRTLLQALEQRGLEIRHSYQVNLGGNTDFKNLSHRGDAKKRSKMRAVSTVAARDAIDILPSGGFVRGLGDNKVAYISIEGRGWLDMPVTIDLKLKVQDSSNAAGVSIDLVRLAKGARDRGLAGAVDLSYYFKNPPNRKLPTEAALDSIRLFDRGD